ncbi:YHYH protein [Puniceicoccaceae bacterium K14]|nr:YHYH protein [Puniceicoccaceae bacterium K14]
MMNLNFLPVTKYIFTFALVCQVFGEPIINSWHLEKAGSYARIWQSIEDETTEKTTGVITSVSTWDADDFEGRPLIGSQTSPVYAGVQGVSYSDDYVYIKSTGLGTHTMGPWYDNTDKTEAFPSFPANAAILYQFPRDLSVYSENYVSSMDTSSLGTNGLMVDGIPIFNSSDGASYDDAGVWNQDAFFNEGTTFDSANAHQAATAHHYHANPAALRHQLGDSVDYDSSVVFTGLVTNGGNNPYTENFNSEHSPIIGWVTDGLPMYGPYGYSDPKDSTSTVRRMISGYQMRDGSNGSYDLETNGRDLLPQWSVDLTPSITSTNPTSDGPAVDETGQYRLGSFIEDYAYKGDLVSDSAGVAFELYNDPSSQGDFDEDKYFDLNQFNVRYCVTPEFPNGTWAYFTSILTDGTPFYPYNVANNYFGDSSLASGVTAIEEDVTIVFDLAENKSPELDSISTDNDEVTLVWDGIEGGIYRLDSSTTLEADQWSEGTEFTAAAQEIVLFDETSLINDEEKTFYRLVRTGISDYDDSEFSSGGGGGPGGGGPP